MKCLPSRLMVTLSLVLSAIASSPATAHEEKRESLFPICTGSKRQTCIVDGDTFWFKGEKIRIADINTPETSHPSCPAELALGQRATQRMAQLLGDGHFILERNGRDEDRYGRKLRLVMRDGTSLGAKLVREGLAEDWNGRRSDWCVTLSQG